MKRPPLPMFAYLDDDGNIIEADGLKFARAMNRKNKIAVENYNGYRISTVFLAIDHGYDDIPMHYETAVFTLNGNEPEFATKFGDVMWQRLLC